MNCWMLTKTMHTILLLAFLLCETVNGLENGLARTPPMGWIHWQRYRCETNCYKYPEECVSERLYKTMAIRMVSDGYLAAGYEYVIIDDCWSAMQRDNDDRLVADPFRFPHGMKALADFVHSLGLKLGLYGDYGAYTCAGYPGSLSHLELDAQTYASWGIDYVKLDGCYNDPQTMEAGFAAYGNYLNATGRPILYSCSWPAYEETSGLYPNYEAATNICNLWRNYRDINDSYKSLKDITAWYVKHQKRLTSYSAPGHWNDPDMLIIGNFGLSFEQAKAQMTIWCLMAAPLIMSNDLVNIAPEFRQILLNQEALAINQDFSGIQGSVISHTHNIEVWRKPILLYKSKETFAFGFVSYREDGVKYTKQYTLLELGIHNENGTDVLDVFTGEQWVVYTHIIVRVPPTGAVFLKLTPRAPFYNVY